MDISEFLIVYNKYLRREINHRQLHELISGRKKRSWPKVLLAVIFVCLGCEPAPCEQKWGYYITNDPHFELSDLKQTPAGIVYDDSGQNVPTQLIDDSTDEVETCLSRSVDRSSFRVKIISNWIKACDSDDQVLPVETYPQGCWAKGLKPTADCPCRYRAYIQCPNTIVVTPNLLLYKDALTRFVTGTQNPWAQPVVCASPHQEK